MYLYNKFILIQGIIDFVGTIIVWLDYSNHGFTIIMHYYVLLHKHSIDNKVLFIAAFWNRNTTVTNNTAQNNNSLLIEIIIAY